MFSSTQTLFRRCFQRRIRIRSLIIRRNSFCTPPEQLLLFLPHDSDDPQVKTRLHRLVLILDHLRDRIGIKIQAWRRSRMTVHSDKISNTQ